MIKKYLDIANKCINQNKLLVKKKLVILTIKIECLFSYEKTNSPNR